MDPEIAEWLQRALLTIGYQHRERMYADVEAVLQLFQNFLVPKAETYTHDNGRSQLLLSLIGTVPIVYQSATYNIPVAFWLPTSYPSVAPIVFVTPTALMLVKPGKYVDVSGRCYHPYLAYWNNRSDSNLVGLISVMQGVFSQEPPVYAKSNVSSQQQQQQQSSPTMGSYPSPTTSLRPAPPILNYSPRSGANTSTTQPSGANPQLNRSSSSSAAAFGPSAHPLTPQQAQLHTKLQTTLLEYKRASSREMDTLVTVNKQLNDAENSTKAEIESLRDLHTKIQYNITTLTRCIEQLNAKIEQIQAWPEEPVDEIICGSSVVHNQLFELVAEEIAIEDTIYLLGKALSQDKVELNAYMKHLRNLSREQFMKKALIKKVKVQLGHVE
ncbi:ESCRT-I complex subunit TSG101 [Entomortierella parvispora]|uniref:ESCRT-I complex subunit TSG101 n=1 Tax=Entomortierella parvispora TaxID=205924 RepID=A0A9P3H8M2_9FUNG|nr:ESCRT-I complex subunit TSG101 [Entomortierella parvispora]